MSYEVLLDKLRQTVKAAGGQRAWADAHGVTKNWINNVMRERVKMSHAMMLELGYRRVVEYEPLANR